MATKEEDFKRRFAAIIADVRSAASDPDELLLLGSLADRIVSHARQATWSAFKSTLSLPTYRSLLTSFQNQGNALAQQGALRQMHAIEVLACSLIARTQVEDRAIVADDQALNRLIDDAIQFYRDSQSADPIIS